MNRRIVLAYDGSINADWVARYALQMAANLPAGNCSSFTFSTVPSPVSASRQNLPPLPPNASNTPLPART